MSKAVLDPKGYGRKIYDRFPKVYKREDENYKYTLRRYLDAVGDGAEPFIEEANGLLDFYDPIKSPTKVLPFVFSSFGLDIFHGIPELYVRNLLPLIGQLYKRKGTFDVVEYLTEVITDSRVTVSVVEYADTRATFGEAVFNRAVFADESGKTIGILIDIEVDYGNSRGILPDKNQIRRIIKEFVPFYCLVIVVYSYVYDDKANLDVREHWHDYIYPLDNETPALEVTESGIVNLLEHYYKDEVDFTNTRKASATSILGRGTMGIMMFGGDDIGMDALKDSTLERGMLGYMVLAHHRSGFNIIEDGTFGRAKFGDSVMGVDYSKWMRYVIKAPYQVDDWEDNAWEKTIEALYADARDRHIKDIAIDDLDTSSGYLGSGQMGRMEFFDYSKNADRAKFFANEAKSDIVGHYVEEEADRFISTGYLPPRSAVFRGGQPLGKSVLGVNQPYTSVDYTVDEIIYSNGNTVQNIVD